jgi:hypothetical protein
MQSFRRSLISGAVLAAVAYILHGLLGLVHWSTPAGYLLIGVMYSCLVLGFDRLWFNAVAVLMRHRDSLLASLTRLPFWYMAGGVAYVLGMLLAKRFGSMGFYDVPVKALFSLGGKLGIAIQLSSAVIARYAMIKSSQHHSV